MKRVVCLFVLTANACTGDQYVTDGTQGSPRNSGAPERTIMDTTVDIYCLGAMLQQLIAGTGLEQRHNDILTACQSLDRSARPSAADVLKALKACGLGVMVQ